MDLDQDRGEVQPLIAFQRDWVSRSERPASLTADQSSNPDLIDQFACYFWTMVRSKKCFSLQNCRHRTDVMRTIDMIRSAVGGKAPGIPSDDIESLNKTPHPLDWLDFFRKFQTHFSHPTTSRDNDDSYRGFLGPYEIVLSEPEIKALENFPYIQLPSVRDWEAEFEARDALEVEVCSALGLLRKCWKLSFDSLFDVSQY